MSMNLIVHITMPEGQTIHLLLWWTPGAQVLEKTWLNEGLTWGSSHAEHS